MALLPQYIPMAKAAFSAYLDQQLDLETLLEKLHEMELQILADEEEATEKVLWFRFFNGDNFKTTVAEIDRDLQQEDHPSCQILKSGIAYGLQTDELEVHFSRL